MTPSKLRATAEILGIFGDDYLSIPGVACLWSRVSTGPGAVGPVARRWIENGTPPADRVACPVDLEALKAREASSM